MNNRLKLILAKRFSTSYQVLTEKSLDVYRSLAPWEESHGIKVHSLKAKAEIEKELYPNFVDKITFTLRKIGDILIYKHNFKKFIEDKILEKNLLSQQFIEARYNTLGPDLAAAHFIVHRGGSVKFWGQPHWVGVNQKIKVLPQNYIPGFYIEAIDAHGTDLYYEGLINLQNLKKIKWLSLKGLVNLNDFALDFISGCYGPQLKYLDLSGCKGITHYGLSSFYRFTQLKVLNLAGIEHCNEFKLTCIMIQDLLPDLEIMGIDFSIPEIPESQYLAIENGEKNIQKISGI